MRALRLIVFEVAVGQVVVGLGVREGVSGESIVDVPYLSFRESVREHFGATLSDTQGRVGFCHSQAER